MDETNLFGQRIYELRKQSGLSQEGLADLLGVMHLARRDHQ